MLMISARADVGGGPAHIYGLIAGLRDFEVFVACPRDEPYWARYKDTVGGERMFELPHRSLGILALLRCASWSRRQHIDVVHSHGKGAGVYSRPVGSILGIPVVHTFHGVHVGAYGRWRTRMYRWLERLLSGRTSAVVAVSQGEAARIRDMGMAPRDKVVVIPNGVDVPQFASSNPDEDPFRVIVVSRFNIQKNADALLDIAELLLASASSINFEIVVLGDGDGRESFERVVAARGLKHHIRCLGPVEDVRRHLRQSHVFLSTSRWEGLPLAVLEAMSEALPVVLSDVVGHRGTVVDGQTGMLFPLSCPEDAVHHLEFLATHPEARRRYGEAARSAVISQYSEARMVAAVSNLYESLAGLRRS